MPTPVERLQVACDLVAASNVGYDQGQRWSFYPARDGATVLENAECDCSSSCGAIAKIAGFNVDLSDPFWTGNFAERLQDAGFTLVRFSNLDAVQVGDFLVGPGHVVFVRDERRWWSAEGDEAGHATGGQAGDQTGKETLFRAPYVRSRGWDWIVRPPAALTVPATVPALARTIRLGVRGDDVRRLQRIMMERYAWAADILASAGGADGIAGRATARVIAAWQQRMNDTYAASLSVDGQFGTASNRAAAKHEGWYL